MSTDRRTKMLIFLILNNSDCRIVENNKLIVDYFVGGLINYLATLHTNQLIRTV